MKEKHKPYVLGAIAIAALLYGRQRSKQRAQANAKTAAFRPSAPTFPATGRM